MITIAERDAARDYLRRMFPKGATVSTITLHVARTGMSRAVAVLAPDQDERTGVVNVSWLVARALGWKLHPQHNGVNVQGAGMDMHFHLVYTLAQALYGDGYALNKRSV